MLFISAALVIVCGLLTCMAAYIIFDAHQSQKSHKAQLLTIQKRLAEKQAYPNTPPAPKSPTRIALAGERNSQLGQIVERIREASSSSSQPPSITGKARPSESAANQSKQ